MPSRKLVKTADSAEIQGKDSYVSYTEPSNADMRDFRQTVADFTKRAQEAEKEFGSASDEVNQILDEAEEYQRQFLASYIEGWNWVADEDGEIPLPKPKNNPDAFKDLLPSESKFLGGLFNVSIEKKLKSSKRS